jgi:hypothetical protein
MPDAFLAGRGNMGAQRIVEQRWSAEARRDNELFLYVSGRA